MCQLLMLIRLLDDLILATSIPPACSGGEGSLICPHMGWQCNVSIAAGPDLAWSPAFEGVAEVAGQPPVLSINNKAATVFTSSVADLKAWQGQKCLLFVTAQTLTQQSAQETTVSLRLQDPTSAQQLLSALTWPGQAGPSSQPPANNTAALSVFEAKTDKGSADLYFNYYGRIQHQQNMLQDYVRTGLYYAAITQNSIDFAGKVVMDVGAGSGILSLFAAQAGARKVYAVEASGMAKFAAQLCGNNPPVGSVIEVINAKLEDLNLPEKVDILISEPMGTLLVNERMIETYLIARDRWLKPGGKMFPQVGRIHVACFSDEVLHNEVAAKAVFWAQTDFFRVNMTPLYTSAMQGYFSQPVVDAMDAALLCSSCASHILDFATCSEEQLHEICMPLQLQITSAGPCVVHGLATWFDVLFAGSQAPLWLSTAPGLPTTHWFQLRLLLSQPLHVLPGTLVTGQLRLVAHRHQSYDVHLTLEAPPCVPGGERQVARGMYDLKEPYYRQLTTGWRTDTTTAQ